MLVALVGKKTARDRVEMSGSSYRLGACWRLARTSSDGLNGIVGVQVPRIACVAPRPSRRESGRSSYRIRRAIHVYSALAVLDERLAGGFETLDNRPY